MIRNNLLNQIITEKDVVNPLDFLSMLNTELNNASSIAGE